VQPNEAEIRAQLERVLASEGFANADRMSTFLRFVVERALAGESDQVKEYLIGVEVFERNDQYDPRIDSIVRVEARRLRTKLDEYYAGPGREDPIVFRIPRGSYVPTFDRRETPVPAPAPGPIVATSAGTSRTGWRVGFGLLAITIALVALAAWRNGLWATNGTPRVAIAVLPFAEFSGTPSTALLAARLTDGVASELARLRTVSVVSRTSTSQFKDARRPLREIAQELHADVIMEASVLSEGDRVRVDARLVSASTDRKFWVQNFVAPAADVSDLPRRIAAGVAAAATAR